MDCNLSPCLFLLAASILWTRFQKLGPLRRPTQEGSSTHLSARCACKVSNEKGCRVDSQRSVCHFPETSVFKAISVLHKIETSKPVPLTCPSRFKSNSLIAWICLAAPRFAPLLCILLRVSVCVCFCRCIRIVGECLCLPCSPCALRSLSRDVSGLLSFGAHEQTAASHL